MGSGPDPDPIGSVQSDAAQRRLLFTATSMFSWQRPLFAVDILDPPGDRQSPLEASTRGGKIGFRSPGSRDLRPGPRSFRHGLLKSRAGGQLDTLTCGNLNFLAGAGVASLAGGALRALHSQEARNLDRIALLERIDQDVLERGNGLVGVRLRQTRLLGNFGNKFSTVDGHTHTFR